MALNPRRRRLPMALAVVMLGCFSVAVIVFGLNPRRAVNFGVYRVAAERFMRGETLYRESDAAMPFKYLPQAALVFYPFLRIGDARASAVVWNLASVLALVAAFFQVARKTPSKPAALRSWTPLLLCCALSQSIWLELFYGQVDCVCLLCTISSYVFAREKRSLLAGALLVLGVLLKPTAGWVLIAILLEGLWLTVTSFVVLFLVSFAPLFARYGGAGAFGQLSEWRALVARTTEPWVAGANSQGIASTLIRLVRAVSSAELSTYYAMALSVALCLSAILLARRNEVRFSVSLLGVSLVSPLAWRANFVFALPALFHGLELRSKALKIACLLCLLVELLCSPFVLPEGALRVVLSWSPFGVAFGALGILLLAHRPAKLDGEALRRLELESLSDEREQGGRGQVPVLPVVLARAL